MKWPEDYVRFIAFPFDSSEYRGIGWYYVDETQGLNGVYPTKDAALEQLLKYVKWLNG